MTDYECLRRVIGICGDGCTPDSKNAQCPNYYPCHFMGGQDLVTYVPWRAMEIKSELLKKLEAVTLSSKPSSVVLPLDD